MTNKEIRQKINGLISKRNKIQEMYDDLVKNTDTPFAFSTHLLTINKINTEIKHLENAII